MKREVAKGGEATDFSLLEGNRKASSLHEGVSVSADGSPQARRRLRVRRIRRPKPEIHTGGTTLPSKSLRVRERESKQDSPASEGKDITPGEKRLSPFPDPRAPLREQVRSVVKFYREAGRETAGLVRELGTILKEGLEMPDRSTVILKGRIGEILKQGDPAARATTTESEQGPVLLADENDSGTMVVWRPGELPQSTEVATRPVENGEHQQGSFAYPHPYKPDWRDQAHPFTLPAEVAETIAGIESPIVELSGPKQYGYRLIKDAQLFSSEPVITNPYYADGQTVEHLDPTHMPFFDGSIGMFMIGHMASVDWQAFEAEERRRGMFGVMEQQDRWERQANQEMRAIIQDPRIEPKYNMHAKAIREVARTLVPNGLLMADYVGELDIAYAARLGLEVIYYQPDWNHANRIAALFRKNP